MIGKSTEAVFEDPLFQFPIFQVSDLVWQYVSE